MPELAPVGVEDGRAILDVLARYAQVIDNGDFDELGSVFTPDVVFGGVQGFDAIAERIGAVTPYHPHHTTNSLLGLAPDGTVRAWSKYVIVRTDGTAGSGDYLDTLVRTPQGWRISRRDVHRGNRRDDDPGGASVRTWTFDDWRKVPGAGGVAPGE
ncbi:SnoaL-like protein [Pseudonocardia sediminis]|uniref:SnoaL-like protein n=1 Tax=Pseudonocardia sediminis TaxID=1397368 RepID=A0A4Q7V1L6_PSEST|nr:nuclear transport factor 2 family protein [Pseudonocardia sediminis]RZT87211.1 SnoaL-like protein [Pseudonocardia sediminis]